MIRHFTRFWYDTETLPNGDFVLYLRPVGMDETFTRKFVNPSEEFLKNLIQKWSLMLPYQKFDFMRLYLYLSNLESRNRGYSEWFTRKINVTGYKLMKCIGGAYESNS